MDGPICVVGDGQMGLVLAGLVATKGHPTRLWSPFADAAEELALTRESSRLPGFLLPDSIEVTNDDAAVSGAAVIIAATPTQFIRPVWSRLAAHVNRGAVVVSVAKGIEEATMLAPLEVIADVLGEATDLSERPMVAASGPTIAAELARQLPASLVAASCDLNAAERTQALLHTRYLRLYTNDDVVGVEIAGAVKNVIAIAAGIVDGLELGHNAKSALLSRGLAEITRLGMALGARAETFFGLAGVGDLATTCFCPLGRNRTCGERLGRGESLEQIVESTPFVIEGIATARSVATLSARHGIEMPIAEGVYEILFNGMKPSDAIARLMERDPKAERVG